MNRPKSTAGAIIFHPDDQNKVLLTKREVSPFKGYWCLPGGHIELYETARDAAIREVKEETGLDFEPTHLGYFDEIFPDKEIHNVVQIYYGSGHGEPDADPGEVSEMDWFTMDDALDMELAFVHHDVLKAYKNNHLSG
jgi:8-oxo-dGTP diphosphatase